MVSFIHLMEASNLSVIRGIIGYGLGFARAAANLINFNCALLLLTVCRNLISFLRQFLAFRAFSLDKNISLHRWIALWMVFWTIVHIIAHYFNYLSIGLTTKTPLETSWKLAMLSGPGLTGQIASVALFLIITGTHLSVRKTNFEAFWISHHLFIVYFGTLLAHGTFCFIKANPGSGDICRGGPTFWKWWLFSGILYTGDRFYRFIRNRQQTQLLRVIQHPSKVFEVQFSKPKMYTKPGQYVFICCPEISRYEWHPFTLTSSEFEKFHSIHIRTVGDWTERFSRRLGCDFSDTTKNDSYNLKIQESSQMPKIMIDGPYGAPAEDIFTFDYVILIGAGIGVTPFASILKSIYYRKTLGKGSFHLQKCVFLWVSRDKQSFEWFQDLLELFEEEGMGEFIDIQIFLSGAMSLAEVNHVMLNHSSPVDVLTRLRKPTVYGRPRFDSYFEKMQKEAKIAGKNVGVFYCGPKPMGKILKKKCNQFSTSEIKFVYKKGKFLF
jgi:predicted ferric reductase